MFFCGWIARTSAGSSVIIAALIVGLFSAVASLGLQGLDLLDIPLADIGDMSAPWKAAADTSLFPSLLIAIAAITAAIVAWLGAFVLMTRALSAVAMVGVGLSLTASGHAEHGAAAVVEPANDFLHGDRRRVLDRRTHAAGCDGAETWASRLLAVLHRFSRVAVPVVAVLVLTGLVLAIVQLDSFSALIETSYGMILSVKLSLVAILLGLAALQPLSRDAGLESRSVEHAGCGDRYGECVAVLPHSSRRRRLALHAAAAHAGSGDAAGDPYPYRHRDVPGSGFTGHSRHR